MRDRIIRTIHRLLLFYTSVIFITCGGTQTFEEGTFRVYKHADVSSLDPMYSNDVTSGELCALIYDGLVQFDENLNVIPNVAVRWEINKNGKEYVFYLRDNALFSNGRAITTADVQFTIERVLKPESKSSRKWLFDNIEGALDYYYKKATTIRGLHIVDDYTVRFDLIEPSYLFLQFLAMPAASLTPREEVKKWGEDFGAHPVGSGPWKLERWEQNNFISLIPNEHYFGTKPKLNATRYRIIPEIMTATSEFEVGTLDMMKIPDAEYERWVSDNTWKNRIQSQEKLAVTYIGLNNQKKWFKDKRVRRALNHAIDIQTILSTMLHGRGVECSGPVPPILLGNPDTQPNKSLYPYNPEKAKQLLQEAGIENGFSMEIWQKHNPETGRILEAVQAYLADVGIKVTIVTRDWSSLKQAINKGEPDAFYLDWYADYPDAENFLFPLFYSSNWGGEGNRARYRNAQVDSLLDSARVEMDKEKRGKVYETVNDIVYDDAPWIFLWHPKMYIITQPWVHNYRLPMIFNGTKLLSVSIGSSN